MGESPKAPSQEGRELSSRDLFREAHAAAEARAQWVPEPLELPAVAGYLAGYGYAAEAADAWAEPPALRLDLQMGSHHECVIGRTWYDIHCRLRNPSTKRKLEWSVSRRLCSLREQLHDCIKEEMGEAYRKHFSAAPFASHGGLVGTSRKLNSWFQALSGYINSGSAPPVIVAATLKYLEAPCVPEPRKPEAPCVPEPRKPEAPCAPEPRKLEAPCVPEPRKLEAPCGAPEPKKDDAPCALEPNDDAPCSLDMITLSITAEELGA